MAKQICSKCYTCIDDRYDLTEARGVLPVVCFSCMIEDEFPTVFVDPTEIGCGMYPDCGPEDFANHVD